MDYPPQYTRLIEYIREENSSRTQCVEDQIPCAIWFYENDVLDRSDRSKSTSDVREAIGDQFDHQTATVLGKLSEISILEETRAGGNRFVANERVDEVFFDPSDPEIPRLIDEEIELFIDALHARDRPLGIEAAADGGEEEDGLVNALRLLAADVLDVPPEYVEEALREPDDPFDRMNQYSRLVTQIKESPNVEHRGEYDEMGWRRAALKYSLSDHAVHLVRNESLT